MFWLLNKPLAGIFHRLWVRPSKFLEELKEHKFKGFIETQVLKIRVLEFSINSNYW